MRLFFENENKIVIYFAFLLDLHYLSPLVKIGSISEKLK